jgi:hypothetical protein
MQPQQMPLVDCCCGDSISLVFIWCSVLSAPLCVCLQGSPLQQLNVSDSGLAKLKELLPDVPDKGPAL